MQTPRTSHHTRPPFSVFWNGKPNGPMTREEVERDWIGTQSWHVCYDTPKGEIRLRQGDDTSERIINLGNRPGPAIGQARLEIMSTFFRNPGYHFWAALLERYCACVISRENLPAHICRLRKLIEPEPSKPVIIKLGETPPEHQYEGTAYFANPSLNYLVIHYDLDL